MRINHLAGEASPYLLRHAANPVDWHPWSGEALERAAAEDKPVFLHIGYAACHWCHLMEREQFENEETVRILNRDFVSIAVDREERPDVEKVYLAAVQLMSGKAGWPLSVFLTPGGRPFYGGTYFPPESRRGLPSFRQVLGRVIESFRENRDRLNMSADIITQQVQGVCYPSPSPGPLDRGLVDQGTLVFTERFDERYGGLRGTPKFPPAAGLSFLFRTLHRTGDPDLLLRIQKTLDGMSRGGIYDQLGGGFHRYSTDARWLIPSFEKTLPDNALLVPVYLDAFLLTGVEAYVRLATETLSYLVEELGSPGPGFYASEDAEIDGDEGRYYLWSEDEILDVLGPDDGRLFCDLFDVSAAGNFERGLSVLHRSSGMGGLARRARMERKEFVSRFLGWRQALLERRRTRPRPAVDDKIVTAWNGLVITALARQAQVTRDPACSRRAEEVAGFLLEHLRDGDGSLLRFYREGPSRQRGFLDDYAYLAAGLLDLYETDFNPRWLEECRSLIDRMIALFWDPENGGFFYSADGDLLVRPKEFEDGATPSANAVATFTLLRLGVLLGSKTYLEKGAGTLEPARGLMAKAPAALGGALSALDFYLSPTREVAVAGRRSDPKTEALLGRVWGRYLPNRVLALADPDLALPFEVPLLEDKTLVDGQPAAYLCENYRCEQPITDPDRFSEAL